jgi:DNA-binding IclR family transcriptional regulator
MIYKIIIFKQNKRYLILVKKKENKTSLEKALDLVEILKEKEQIGVTELSNLLGLNKNNVFRLLATLQVVGAIEQDEETGYYKLGKKVLYLENSYLKGLRFLKEARPFLKELKNIFNETVYISILSNTDIVYIYSEEANRSVLVHSRIGKRYHAEMTAPGRAILKAKKEKKNDYIVEYDFEAFEKEVSEIATVLWDDRYPKAAVSIVAPISRLNPSNILEFKEKLLDIAGKASEKISNR